MMCCVTRSGNWTMLALYVVSTNVSAKGESYSELSELFDRVFFHYLAHLLHQKYMVGSRSGVTQVTVWQLPFETVPVEKQRQALATLQKYIFAEDAFKFHKSC